MSQLALAFAPAAPFVDQLDEPYLYHDIRRPGFTAFFTPGQTVRQTSVRLSDLPRMLTGMQSGNANVYIAQNEFFRPNRRAVNCWRMTSCYVDLDTYKLEHLYGSPPEALTDKLLRVCEDAAVPPPSVVVYSGRGLQAKWLLAAPVPRQAMPRWYLVQKMLATSLEGMGADYRALDASRVLRLVGTVNGRSGDTVRVVYEGRTPTMGASLGFAGLVVYDFDELATQMAPYSRDELAEKRADALALRQQDIDADLAARRRRAARRNLVALPGKANPNNTARRLVPSQLAWDRLDDLRTLAALRHAQGGLPTGERNTFVFLGACFLASAVIAPKFMGEVWELAREFAPTWTPQEVNNCVSAVKKRVELAARGESVEYLGKAVDPRYRFANDTLLQWLSITSSEMAQLRTILSHDEAKRRDRVRHELKRRAAGAVPRADYLAAADNRRQRARQLRDSGLSLSQIAQELGIDRSTVSRYCKPPSA